MIFSARKKMKGRSS